ncbi:MAG: hypothetical protein ACK52V_12615 [Betaproteobacteria bacterium]|jgi:hypothetical protein
MIEAQTFQPGDRVAIMRRGAVTHIYAVDAPCFIVERKKTGWKVEMHTPHGISTRVIAETNLRKVTNESPGATFTKRNPR